MTLFNWITIFKEKPGVISPESCWVILGGGYMYIDDTLLGVLWLALTEWKHDRHLAM
jgi:hypothetical protein